MANSFATSVGAGTITYAQACIIACFAEYISCIALRKNVTDTIRWKIVDDVDLLKSAEKTAAFGIPLTIMKLVMIPNVD